MPFGMQVGLEPVNIVLDDDPASSPTRDTAPIFGPRLLWQMAGWIKMPLGREIGLVPGDIVHNSTNPIIFIAILPTSPT